MAEIMHEYQLVVDGLKPFFKYGLEIQKTMTEPIDVKSEVTVEQLDGILTKANDLKSKITGNMKDLVGKVNELENLVNSK